MKPSPPLPRVETTARPFSYLKKTPSSVGGSARGVRLARFSTSPAGFRRRQTAAPSTICPSSASPKSGLPGVQKCRHSTTKGSTPAGTPAPSPPPLALPTFGAWPSHASIQQSDRSCSGRSRCSLKCGGCAAGASSALLRSSNGRPGAGPVRSLGAALRPCLWTALCGVILQLNSIDVGGYRTRERRSPNSACRCDDLTLTTPSSFHVIVLAISCAINALLAS
mmetsp:Transcript_34733/g.108193  ORF Transcript_34733/g.108193 Transcript_34733/m.108193 type:complete len:223 (+) Transcript_34733:122-790(+)